mgnify:FL=1
MSIFKRTGTKLRQSLLSLIWRTTIHTNEHLFRAYVRNDPVVMDSLIQGLDRPDLFDWDSVTLPPKLEHFEDLAFVFWLTPLNRGLLRQDIDEAFALFRTVNSLHEPIGVEIGRAFGASTILLALAVGHRGRIVSIDIAPQHDIHLRTVLERFGLDGRVDLIVDDANNVILDQQLDFVFIDGDHSYQGAKRDHNRWAKRVKPGGYIIHHDMANARPYATQWESLRRLREEILLHQKTQVELVEEVGSLSVFRRTGAEFDELE